MSGEINSGYGMDKEKRLRTTGRHFRAFTSSYGWCTFGGCMQRISFAWTMGLVSLALSGVLWLLFIPWISRDLYRWGWGPIERVSNRCWGFVPVQLVAGVGAVLVAALISVASIMASLVVWVCGLWGAGKWYRWRFTKEGKEMSGETELHCPTAMPGKERGDHWQESWKLAKALNYRIPQEHESLSFHVAPLTKGTAGLGLEHLVMLVKMRSERSDRRKEWDEVDCEVASGHVFPQRSRET